MFYINQLRNPSFPIGLVKTESGFNVRSVENGSVSLHLFLVMWLFLRSLDVICYDRCIHSEVTKVTSKDWCLMNSQPTFLFLTYLNLTHSLPATSYLELPGSFIFANYEITRISEIHYFCQLRVIS